MPLVWAHAEFIKTGANIAAAAPVDRPARTWARYGGRHPQLDYALWQPRQRVKQLVAGQDCVCCCPKLPRYTGGKNDWQNPADVITEDWGLGYVARLPDQRAYGRRAHRLHLLLA